MRLILIFTVIVGCIFRTPGRAADPKRSVRFFAEEMVCALLLVNAEDGSSLGFLVTLSNTSQDNSYRLEGYGRQLLLSAIWSDAKGQWEDALNIPYQGDLQAIFWVKFAPGQRSSVYVPFTALMTKPLPVETVNDWEIDVCPYFFLTGIRWGTTSQWEDRSKECTRFYATGDKMHEFTGLTLRRSTLEAAAWRYAPQNRKVLPKR